MRIHRKRLTLLILSLTLTVAFALALGTANQSAGPQESKTQELTPENDVPILDLKHAETTGSDQLKGRKRRNSLRQDKKIAELPPNVEPLPFSAHALVRLPPLPVEQSNVIILGKVTERRALLTDDRLGIYSEFTIGVSEIFKDDLNVLFDGQALTASRPGGAIRFPSGRIQQYTIFGKGYPQQDKVYVLFLKRDEEGDYSIQTGYEVTELWSNFSMENVTFLRTNATYNLENTGGSRCSHSVMRFKKRFNTRREGGINENTSQSHSQPHPHRCCHNVSDFTCSN